GMISLSPPTICNSADGTLQQVLAPSAQVRFAIHAVWPEGPWLPQKTRAAIDALREGLPLTATPG
ncbi:hypothetical protein GNF44_26980, partial [Klebsiella pneumoniae]|nr:hypothetical protein [Klebsiella pneumoniae]MUB88681.1 hypothetical protein [Klebsiella pneumoniae]